MPDFIPGLELNRMFYQESVRPILDSKFPGLRHSAALIGYGSDVLGYDSPRSTDHEWGPRPLVFLEDDDYATFATRISETLSKSLPTTFRGYSTSFSLPDENGVRVPEAAAPGNVRHHVQILTLRSFLRLMLDIDPDHLLGQPLRAGDWLALPEQKLLEVTSGAVYHDGLGRLTSIRDKLAYYPHEVWLYVLIGQWTRIAQEEHFMGRCAEAGDELGSRIVAARLVRDLMRLCFLIERKYAPYSKWLGTAFARLACGAELSPVFARVLSSDSWQERERNLSAAYRRVARMHNALGITQPIEAKVQPFHGRPFLILNAGRFAKAINDNVRGDEIRSILSAAGPIGSINQFVDNTDALMRADLWARLKAIFG